MKGWWPPQNERGEKTRSKKVKNEDRKEEEENE